MKDCCENSNKVCVHSLKNPCIQNPSYRRVGTDWLRQNNSVKKSFPIIQDIHVINASFIFCDISTQNVCLTDLFNLFIFWNAFSLYMII